MKRPYVYSRSERLFVQKWCRLFSRPSKRLAYYYDLGFRDGRDFILPF